MVTENQHLPPNIIKKAKSFDHNMSLHNPGSPPPLSRSTIRAFGLIRKIHLAYSERTIQGVFKDVFMEGGKLYFTHDKSQINHGDFLWSANPFASLGTISERDKHAVMEFSQCARDVANLAPIIDTILKGKFCHQLESGRAFNSYRFTMISISR